MTTREETNATFNSALMTVDQLAEYFNVSRAWVYKKVERGEIPFFRAGGLKFSRKQVVAWLNEQQAPQE